MSRRSIQLALLFCITSPVVSSAQGPWTVTLKSTMDPLPAGACAAVQLTLFDPATRDVPRTPLGARVTLADFDISVTTSDGISAAAKHIDAYHVSACGCQGATPGTVATVTATYPAQGLAAGARISDVAFQQTATFTLSAPRGDFNPPECALLASGAGPLLPPTSVVPSAAVAGTPAVPLPNPPAAGTKVAVVTTPPAAPPGPPPWNLKVQGTPAEAIVGWSALPATSGGPVGFEVERWKTADPACCRAKSPRIPWGADWWRDPVMWPGSWTYAVTAIYHDGRRGTATVSYDYVGPVTPTGVKAQQHGGDTVVVTWQPVAGASYYVVSGPPTNTARRVDGTRFVQAGLPGGPTTWKVAAMYLSTRDDAPQQSSDFATASVTVISGKYRLVAEAVRVTAETVDAPLSGDGKFDEIFVAARAVILGGNGARLYVSPVRSSIVHGDASFWPSSERRQAGTGSANGGIKAGDIVSPIWSAPGPKLLMGAPNMVLWEGQLTDPAHTLLLHPTIWEVDEPASALSRTHSETGYCGHWFCNWADNFTNGNAFQTQNKPAVAAAIAGSQIRVLEGAKMSISGVSGQAIYLERHNRDRPIGLVVTTTTPTSFGLVGTLMDRVVVLSRPKIEAALASGQNRIEVRFWDHYALPNSPPAPVNYLNGDYTLVIRIERVP